MLKLSRILGPIERCLLYNPIRKVHPTPDAIILNKISAGIFPGPPSQSWPHAPLKIPTIFLILPTLSLTIHIKLYQILQTLKKLVNPPFINLNTHLINFKKKKPTRSDAPPTSPLIFNNPKFSSFNFFPIIPTSFSNAYYSRSPSKSPSTKLSCNFLIFDTFCLIFLIIMSSPNLSPCFGGLT
jgi:hypothetical protein